MTIAFFVESYYHKPMTNGICVQNVAECAVKKGHNVVVFTSERTIAGLPKQEILNGVKVIRIKRDIITRMKLSLQKSRKNIKVKRMSIRLCEKIRNLLLLWLWPLCSCIVSLRYYFVAKKEFTDNVPDSIVGTYFCIEEVLGSLLLKKKYKNAIHLTYSLDAMAGRLTPDVLGTPLITRSTIKRWEKFVLKRTDYFCAMEAHRHYFEESKYSDFIKRKVSFLDVPLMKLDCNSNSELHTEKTIIKIVYTGYSSRETGSAVYLIQLLKYVDEVELHMYGTIDDEIKNEIDKCGLKNTRVFYHGFIDHSEIAAVQENADFLATFGSKNACMISGKIFEYFSKKKPIISTYQIHDDLNIQYLAKYPKSLLIFEDRAKIAENVKRLKEFISDKGHGDISNDYLINQFYRNTPDAMVEFIHNAREETINERETFNC